MYQVPLAARDAVFAAFKTASLTGGAMGLYINDFTPDDHTVIGDFAEPGAEWGGYSRTTVAAWGPTFEGTSGKQADALVSVAGPTTGTVGDTVYGWLYVDSGGALVASGRFEEGTANPSVGGAVNVLLKSLGLFGGAAELVSVL